MSLLFCPRARGLHICPVFGSHQLWGVKFLWKEICGYCLLGKNLTDAHTDSMYILSRSKKLKRTHLTEQNLPKPESLGFRTLVFFIFVFSFCLICSFLEGLRGGKSKPHLRLLV